MTDTKYDKQKSPQAQEKNIAAKAIASLLVAGGISAFALAVTFTLMTAFQPSTGLTTTASTCGEDKGDGDPKILVCNSCGCGEGKDKDKDKDGGDDKSLDA